jgi:hypothetical protein
VLLPKEEVEMPAGDYYPSGGLGMDISSYTSPARDIIFSSSDKTELSSTGIPVIDDDASMMDEVRTRIARDASTRSVSDILTEAAKRVDERIDLIPPFSFHVCDHKPVDGEAKDLRSRDDFAIGPDLEICPEDFDLIIMQETPESAIRRLQIYLTSFGLPSFPSPAPAKPYPKPYMGPLTPDPDPFKPFIVPSAFVAAPVVNPLVWKADYEYPPSAGSIFDKTLEQIDQYLKRHKVNT